jgi:glycosyltransferase involved in cell wall biosynthesis
MNRRMERQVLAAADRVACVSEPWLNDLFANLGKQREKFIVLPNGYDDEDIQPSPLPGPGDQFTLTHLGSFYRNRRPDQIIQAVSRLIADGRIPTQALRVQFVGKNARSFVPDTPPFIVSDYVPHDELDTFRAQSHAFLLILATTHDNIGNYSGKLFEYLAANRPILAIAPRQGVAQQLIEKTRTGIVVSEEPAEIAWAIETLYRQWKANYPDWKPAWEIIQQYNRRSLTARLASEFDGLARIQKKL